VRTTQSGADVMIAAGYGARYDLDLVRATAERLSAEVVTTRKAVDNDLLPYGMQVGLTGKTVSPLVYIAVGVSGAVHHIAGMQKAGTIIAINPDKDAPIFEYADYGIVGKADEVCGLLLHSAAEE
jgi:electron transfer flavoprotein alpha subunit